MRPTIPRSILLGLLMARLVWPGGSLPALAQSQPQNQPPQNEEKQKPEYTLTMQVPAVNLDVVVTDEHGDVLSGFKKENFRILDSGVPQTITNFAPTEAPITIVMLMEFSRLGYEYFAYTAKYWGYGFLNHLKQDDWVALVTYSMRPNIEVDFTRNKSEVQQKIASLYFPGFTEANLFDALLDTLDRLQDVKGKKSILILASGFDTFSRHTLDNVLKRLKQTDATIFAVGVARQLMEYADAHGYVSGAGRVGYLQAENQLRSFAQMTGGYAWFPRFDGELPDIFNSVAGFLRNQYSLAFTPSNVPMDGKFHKIKVELVGNDGQPLVVTNEKGKKVKYKVYAREGYEAPKSTAGN